MRTFFKNILIFSLLVMIITIPILVSADIIPCGGHIIDEKTGKIIGEQKPCDFNFLLVLVNNIIKWIIMISVPVAAGVFAWAGFKYMTTGISDQKAEAKKMLGKVFWGFIFILTAWIIVTTILNALLSDNPELRKVVPVEGVKK